MLKKLHMAVGLAARDWCHERTLSLCAVVALASMLTPLLVLQGLKNGVVSSMRERLLEDPAVLIITPKSDAGRFSRRFIEELRELPGARFAIGRTRETSADMTLQADENGSTVTIAMEPCAPGEPVLEHAHIPAPNDGEEPEIVLSTTAARALKVGTGDRVTARLGRRTPEGKLESTSLHFRVAGVLPATVADRRMGFLPQQVLEDVENYRDYLAVPSRGFSGQPAKARDAYASFRLYAANLDAVESLAAALEKEHLEVTTKAREIASIRLLESSINQIILIISLAVGAGFVAFTLSSVQGAVRRKLRMLGILRLLGLPQSSLLLYPVTQSLLTASVGLSVALLLYAAVSQGIRHAFASQSAVLTCSLPPSDMAAAAGIVLLLSLLASAKAALAAASVEPSMVIREV